MNLCVKHDKGNKCVHVKSTITTLTKVQFANPIIGKDNINLLMRRIKSDGRKLLNMGIWIKE